MEKVKKTKTVKEKQECNERGKCNKNNGWWWRGHLCGRWKATRKKQALNVDRKWAGNAV